MIFHFNLCLVCSFAAAADDDDVATDDLADVEKNCAYMHGRRWILRFTRPKGCRRVGGNEGNELLDINRIEGCDVVNLLPNLDVSWMRSFNFVDINDEENDGSEFTLLPEKFTDNILIPDRVIMILLSIMYTPNTRGGLIQRQNEAERSASHKNKI